MRSHTSPVLAAALTLALTAGSAVAAESKGKIVCWKDKAGKVVGCGDTVPPEYQDAATRELDRRGVTRKSTGTVEEEARLAAEAEKKKQQLEDEKRKQADQRRKDQALLDTYLNEGEIDRRRDRELAEVDRVLGQFHGLHKSAVARHADAANRFAAAEKAGKPTDVLKDEVVRVELEKAKIERGIAGREKEKADIQARYAETKRRYAELKGGGVSTPASTPAPAKK